MGKIHISQIDKLDELPSRLSASKANNSDRWSSRNGTYHNVKHITPWKRVERLLKNSIGKLFADVFSDFCKQVPNYQQQYFLKEFQERQRADGYCYNDYYIDGAGLIQRYKPVNPYKGPYTFYSIDCVFERQHKITGKKESQFYWIDKKYNADDYHTVMVKGWYKVFESKHDPEYKRLKAEKQVALDRIHREKYGKPKITDEEFTKIIKAKELKEKAEDLIKITAHGFDPLTSFRKEKKENDAI